MQTMAIEMMIHDTDDKGYRDNNGDRFTNQLHISTRDTSNMAEQVWLPLTMLHGFRCHFDNEKE